jgi:predicted dinucleotide-binding enzyme
MHQGLSLTFLNSFLDLPHWSDSCRRTSFVKQIEAVLTKTIAIFGASGTTGSAIATSLAKNYRLLLFAHEPTALARLERVIMEQVPGADIECMGCAADVTWEADVIISTVPLVQEEELASKIEPFTNEKP